MQTLIDVDQFQAWMEGILLDLHKGKGIVVNELACEEAMSKLEAGEEVLCTKNGKLTGTKLRLKEDNIEHVDCE